MARKVPNSGAQVEAQVESGNRLAWFLTGLAVGAVIGVLYAPKSGRDTRQFLSEKSQQGRDAVTETGKEVMETGRELYERGRNWWMKRRISTSADASS